MSIPKSLQKIIDEFQSAPKQLKIPLLLEYGKKVPSLPEKWKNQRDKMIHVQECQTPFFLITEEDDDSNITFFFDASAEAPTIFGFAGILSEGLNGLKKSEILATPDDFYTQLSLSEIISPMRMRGISAVLRRLKGSLQEPLS